ncbi:MAG: glycoside hydrolase family 88 protein [Planctomycetes bacterium]|nr:glycoside hydrolase family 88 protein [Planctomycetota bacterium]
MPTLILTETALLVLDKAEEKQGEFRHYTGILTMHGAARLAVITSDDALLKRTLGHLTPFVRRERDFNGNFPNYFCGGNGTAWLHLLGKFPEAKDEVRRYAEITLNESVRDRDGILCMPKCPEQEKIWIDVAFAVTPFLLFAGLALEEDKYIEDAWQQTAKMVRQFNDPACDLLHQSKNFNGAGNFSEDHWSRGNGWGMLALTELVNYLPESDPRRPEAEEMFVRLCKGCLAVQDENGMFHQELTDHTSFVETSGTGLLLYGFGVGIEKGLLGDEFRVALEKGLKGYMSYIALDGSVLNTCRGCLCPGNGTIEEYKAMTFPINDPHAFGPVLLSFGQAIRVGIDSITA